MDLFVLIFVFAFAFCDTCIFVVQPRGHLLRKGLTLGSLACYVFLCFCHFPIPCPGSCLVLDFIDS